MKTLMCNSLGKRKTYLWLLATNPVLHADSSGCWHLDLWVLWSFLQLLALRLQESHVE